MAVKKYRVISQHPVVVDVGITSISYNPNDVFEQSPRNASIQKLLSLEYIIEATTADPTSGYISVAGPIGPTGPAGPAGATGPAGPPGAPASIIVNLMPKTADYSLTSGDDGATVTNTGATTEVIITLPAHNLGLVFDFIVSAAQYLRIKNFDNSSVIYFGGVPSSSGGFFRSNTVGSTVRIIAGAPGAWYATFITGVWNNPDT